MELNSTAADKTGEVRRARGKKTSISEDVVPLGQPLSSKQALIHYQNTIRMQLDNRQELQNFIIKQTTSAFLHRSASLTIKLTSGSAGMPGSD